MKDPERLIISEDNELGVALAAARRQLPDEDRLAMLAERLAQAGVAVPRESLGTSAPRADVQSGLRWGPLLKVGLGVVLLGIVGGGASVWYSREASAPAAQTFRRAPEPVIVSESVASAEYEGVSPSRPTVRATPLNAPAVTAAPARRGANQPTIEEPSDAAPVAPTAVAARSVAKTAPAAAIPGAPARSTSARPAPARAVPANDFAEPELQETSESELELLKQARSAVSSDPLRAYALTERSRARYPNAVLAQERDFIAVSALFRIGREQQARAQATSFRSRYPRSAYLPQIARMLGEE